MSGSLYKLFKTNARAEEQGVWLEYEDAKTRVKVTRAGGQNKKFQKKLEALSRPYRRAIQADMMSNEKMRKLTMQTFIATVIVGWECWDDEKASTMDNGDGWVPGVPGEDGTVLEFNKANVEKVLTDLPDLFDDIIDYAQKSAMFREEILEIEAGN